MRIAHTMIRVTDLERSLDFYTRVLGMKVHRRLDFPEGRFTLAFVGFGDEPGAVVLELTHNWDIHEYELGTGFGHLALEVNVDPPNEGSLRFHERLGFVEVGQQDTPYGIRVSMQMRPVSPLG